MRRGSPNIHKIASSDKTLLAKTSLSSFEKKEIPMNGFLLVLSFGFFRIVLPVALLFLIGEWVQRRQNSLRVNS